jgi:hypothetical protein
MHPISRRKFLGGAAALVGVLAGGLVLIRCALLGDDEVTDRTFRTDEASGHTHTVTVKAADMKAPPSSGTVIFSGETDSHTHEVELTAEQLRKVGAYSSFTVETSEENGHVHNITFR